LSADSNRRWGLVNRLGAPFVVSLTIVVLVFAGRLAWWGYQQLPPPRPDEPYCLVLNDEDIAPIVSEVTKVFEGDYSTSGEYWTCRVSGGDKQRIEIEAAPDADDILVNYKAIGVSVLDTVSARPGARVRAVGDATVVSWVGRRDAHAAWFEGKSAVIFSARSVSDEVGAAAQVSFLEGIAIRRGAQLLDEIGFVSTPSPTPDPHWTP